MYHFCRGSITIKVPICLTLHQSTHLSGLGCSRLRLTRCDLSWHRLNLTFQQNNSVKIERKGDRNNNRSKLKQKTSKDHKFRILRSLPRSCHHCEWDGKIQKPYRLQAAYSKTIAGIWSSCRRKSYKRSDSCNLRAALGFISLQRRCGR